MRPCAQSSSTKKDSRASPRSPEPPGETMRVLASGSAARTWRRSVGRRPGPCSDTRSWRVAPTGAAWLCCTTCPAASASAAGPGTSRPARRSPSRRSSRAGSPSRSAAAEGVELPDAIDDATGTYVEPLACVLRGAERVPRGRVLVVGHGFVGRLFSEVLSRRGDEVFAIDSNPERTGQAPDGPVDAAVLCAPAAPLDAVAPGRHRPRLRRRGPGRPGRRLPARADPDGLAVVDAAAHGGRRGAPPRPRPSPTRSCSRSRASPKGSTSTAPAARSRSSSRREGAALLRARGSARSRRCRSRSRAPATCSSRSRSL